MLQHGRHDLRHAAPPCSSSSPSTCSIHQAAAAWARFEQGGSTCITPHKAQGLISARRLATSISSTPGPSRFKQELLRRSIIHHYSSLHSPDPGFCTEDDNHQRRHSFHSYDLTERSSLRTYSWRFSSSCGSAPNSTCFNMGDDADQTEADNGEGGNTSCKDEASSLLDKFEVEAVRKQLHDHFGSRGLSTVCTPSSACGAKRCQEHREAQNARHHDHPQAHLKHRRNYFKSSDAAPKPSADNEHHHAINDVVHRLLHLRIKTTSRRSIFARSGPVLCSSIATANSIVDPHHHPASPVKEFRAVTPSRQTKKQQQDALHDRSPNRLYHSDAIYSKAFHESLASRTLPHTSKMLGHNMHGDNGSRLVDGTVLRKKQQDSHIHIHHFHHHYHHQLKHIDYEPQDALLLQDHQVTDKDGKQYVRQPRPKLHTLRKEKLMIPHGGHH